MSAYLRDPVQESIDFEMLFLFAMPDEAARPLLPRDLKLLPIGKGTGMFALGIQRIASTSFSACRDIRKIYLGIGVQPRYDLGTATPRFAFFLNRMTSNEAAFSEQLAQVNRVPVHPSRSLEIRYDETNLAVEAADADGPIFRLSRTTPDPAFRASQVWGQCHTLVDGKRYTQATFWKGDSYEHAGKPAAGELFPHPLFQGIPVEGLGGRCYHQLMARPRSGAVMTLYRPVAQEGLANV